nr:DUF3667 domain-containing protein [Chitinophaga qingshengii]
MTTLKYLTIRPGFLSKEYWAGRRVRYVNPIKLYVFISFVFFLFLSTLTHSPGHTGGINGVRVNDMVGHYNGVKEFDSLQAALPPNKRLTGMELRWQRRLAELSEETRAGEDVITEMFMHNLPKIMFLLMPLFALMVKWTHRKRKLVYNDHAIFTIHMHSFLFIILLVGLVVRYFIHREQPLNLAYWGAFIYLVLALRNAYQQPVWKALLKGSLLFFAYMTIALTVFIAFILLVLSY